MAPTGKPRSKNPVTKVTAKSLMRSLSGFITPPGSTRALYSAALASSTVKSTPMVSPQSSSFQPLITPGLIETICTVAPAASRAFFGSKSSDCSNPSVAKIATRFPSSFAIVNRLTPQSQCRRSTMKRISHATAKVLLRIGNASDRSHALCFRAPLWLQKTWRLMLCVLNSGALQFLDQSFRAPAANLAADEWLLSQAENGARPATLRFWESPVYFVALGYTNRAATEADLDACAAADVPVLRRVSGGGTVMQGPGCLNYALIHPIAPGQTLNVEATNKLVMETQRAAFEQLLGERVIVAGHTDLATDNLKFSGNAQRRKARTFPVSRHDFTRLRFGVGAALVARSVERTGLSRAAFAPRFHPQFAGYARSRKSRVTRSLECRRCCRLDARWRVGRVNRGTIRARRVESEVLDLASVDCCSRPKFAATVWARDSFYL